MKKVNFSFYLILLPVIFLLSWSLIYLVSHDETIRKKEQPIKEQPEPDLKSNELFPFDKIRRNSIYRKRFLDMDVLPTNLKPINKSFFNKWLENIFVSGAEKRLHYQTPDKAVYHFYDFTETKDLFLFSIITTNFDSVRDEFVHFVCDKATGRINYAEQVAANGGEAGYSIHSQMEYSQDRLTLKVSSEVTQPVDRHWETYTHIKQYTFRPERIIIRNIK